MEELFDKVGQINVTLKSKEIIDYLNQWNIDKMHLLGLVVESKIGYDQLSINPQNATYFNEIEESIIYSTTSYSQLIMQISSIGDTKANFHNFSLLNKFYNFHKMLYRTANLVTNLLSKRNVEVSHDPLMAPFSRKASDDDQSNANKDHNSGELLYSNLPKVSSHDSNQNGANEQPKKEPGKVINFNCESVPVNNGSNNLEEPLKKNASTDENIDLKEFLKILSGL